MECCALNQKNFNRKKQNIKLVHDCFERLIQKFKKKNQEGHAHDGNHFKQLKKNRQNISFKSFIKNNKFLAHKLTLFHQLHQFLSLVS